MRLCRAFRDEHTGGDLGVGIAFRSQHHGFALAIGQRTKQFACLISARARLRLVEIVNQLFLTGCVELWCPGAYSQNAANNVIRSIGFRHKALSAGLHRTLHGAGRTERSQNQYMRGMGQRSQSASCFNAVHIRHGNIHQHHIRLFADGKAETSSDTGVSGACRRAFVSPS